MLVPSRRVIAGLAEETSDVSCGKDVGNALALELEEPVDNPGTRLAQSVPWCIGFSAMCG